MYEGCYVSIIIGDGVWGNNWKISSPPKIFKLKTWSVAYNVIIISLSFMLP